MWRTSQNKMSVLKVDKSNVGPLCRVCETLCRISRLCLGATVYKEGQLCWSSRHCLQLDIWTQFTVGLPAVAEAKASHQKAQTRYTVLWKFRGTSQAQKSTCPLFEVSSTGATLSFRRIPYNSLLYPPESRPWIKVHVSAIFVALFFFYPPPFQEQSIIT